MKPVFAGSLMVIILMVNSKANAQQDKFSTPQTIKDTGTVYSYVKSNWDGTHASRIFLYISDNSRLQSFKWTKGDDWATLVTAGMDWNTFTIKKFTNHRVFKDGKQQLMAALDQRGSGIHFKVGDMSDSMKLTHPFWHSYDFDFAGLGFIWRALKDKQSGFWFHIADAGMVDGKVGFLNKGRVDVSYEGKEMVDEMNCYKYKIDGPGLQNKGGYIWINEGSDMIQQYKIELPDEDGFDNGMLRLEKVWRISNTDWERFIVEKMNQ